MFSNNSRFSRKDLPINSKMKTFWNENGFLIINNFYTLNDCKSARIRANLLVKEFDPNGLKFRREAGRLTLYR